MVTVAEKTARSGGRFIANNDSLILIHWCSRSHFKPFSNSPRIFIKSLPTIWPLDGNVDCFHLIFNRMIHDVSSHIAPIVRGNQLHTLSQTPKLQAVLMSHTARWALSKFFWWWLLLLLLGALHATAARAWSNICIHQHKVDNQYVVYYLHFERARHLTYTECVLFIRFYQIISKGNACVYVCSFQPAHVYDNWCHIKYVYRFPLEEYALVNHPLHISNRSNYWLLYSRCSVPALTLRQVEGEHIYTNLLSP